MNLDKMIAQLRAELAAVQQAITVLEQLTPGHEAEGPRTRRPFSPETRKKMALAQRKRWAAHRKEKKPE